MTRLLAIGLLVAGLALGIYGLLRPQPSATATSTLLRGSEQPAPGATYENGFNVARYPGCDLQGAYAAAQLFTGPPVAGFDGRGQSFAAMRLICDPNDPARRVRFDALGAQAMRARGMVPLPDSEPHPVVRAFLVDAQQQGLGVGDLFGRVISPPRCQGNHCQQYLDNVLLEFSPDGGSGVQFAQLGCQLQLACARSQVIPTTSGSSWWRTLPWLLGAVGLAGVGVVLLVRHRLAGTSSMTI